MAVRTIIRLDGNEFAAGEYRDIRDLRVIESVHGAASAHLELGLMRDGSGTWNHLSAFTPWTSLEVAALYPGGAEEILFSGFVTHLAPRFPRELEKCRLEVVAHDASALMDREDKVRSFVGQRDDEVVGSIAAEYGLSAAADPTADALWEEDGVRLMQRSTDWQFVRALARRNGFEAFVREGELHFRASGLDGEPAPAVSVHFGAESNVTRFAADWDATTPRQAVADDWGVMKSEAVATEVAESDLAPLGAEAIAAQSTADAAGGGAHVHRLRRTIPLPSSGLSAVATAAVRSFSWGLRAEIEFEADDYQHFLRAGQVLPVRGVGERWSGHWYATEVEHRLRAEGYVLRAGLQRNAIVTNSGDFDG